MLYHEEHLFVDNIFDTIRRSDLKKEENEQRTKYLVITVELLIKMGRLEFVAVNAAIAKATTPDRSDPEMQFSINGPVSL